MKKILIADDQQEVRELLEGPTIFPIVPRDDKISTEENLWNLGMENRKKAAPEQPGEWKSEGKIRVMLVDDHLVIRECLSGMLGTQGDMEIEGEASDGKEAVRLAREIVPDVILMDINMPNMNGLEATRIIHSEFPHIRIIGLSLHEEDEMAETMLDAGASAYRSKSGNTAHLLAAIRG